jgi:hypothetical protein
MTGWLEQLGKETLPRELVETFMQWCIWEQARPALMVVLEKTMQQPLAEALAAANDRSSLLIAAENTTREIKQARVKTGPLGLSAAEAAAFEFNSLLRATDEDDWDPEDAAFFAARVCGWAGWAASDFSVPARKTQAEAEARQAQEIRLQTLFRQFGQG